MEGLTLNHTAGLTGMDFRKPVVFRGLNSDRLPFRGLALCEVLSPSRVCEEKLIQGGKSARMNSQTV